MFITNLFVCVAIFHSPVPTEAATATTEAAVSNNKGCSKCGILKKSGKLSCCARGGDWFKNCGDISDSNFGHTWVEGIQACTRFVNLSSVESSELLMMNYDRSKVQSLTVTQSPNTTHHQTNIYPIVDSGTVDDSKDRVELTKIVVCVYLLLISLQSII